MKVLRSLVLYFLLACSWHTYAQQIPASLLDSIKSYVTEQTRDGNIPGLSIIITTDKGSQILNVGYANAENHVPVWNTTPFEIGENSKAFAALAILTLQQKGLLNVHDPVSKFLPWFSAMFNSKKVEMSIHSLLYQISGIGDHAILFATDDLTASRKQVLKDIQSVELTHMSGNVFEPSDMNELLISAIVEKVSGVSYEAYLQTHVFRSLGLTHASFTNTKHHRDAQGYRISFFSPRAFHQSVPPAYVPARGIVMSPEDLAQWLSVLIKGNSDLDSLIQKMHVPDLRLKANDPTQFSAYSMGWNISLNGNGRIYQAGNNPAFSSYMLLDKHRRMGVAVVLNSNSQNAAAIGEYVMNKITHQEESQIPQRNQLSDRIYSVVTIVLISFLIIALGFVGYTLVQIIKGKIKMELLTKAKLFQYSVLGLVLIALIGAPYYLVKQYVPALVTHVQLWMPFSFTTAITLIAVDVLAIYVVFIVSSLFPPPQKTWRNVPKLVIISLIAGLADSLIVLIIANAFQIQVNPVMMFGVFLFALILFIVTNKIAHTRLIQLTNEMIYEKRVGLINKILSSSYYNFEKIDRGKVFTTLNDDTNRIGYMADMLVVVLISSITVLCVIIYLATIAFWVTLVIIGLTAVIASIYVVISSRAEKYLERARDAMNDYLSSINELMDGFKELSLQHNKRYEYKTDAEKVCTDFRDKTTVGSVKFINAFVLGNSLIFIVLGFSCFIIPILFPQVSTALIVSLTMAMLYLISPISQLLSAIPQIVQVKISWSRINNFIQEIRTDGAVPLAHIPHHQQRAINQLEVNSLYFTYPGESDSASFSVGPLNFEAKKGEIIFIIGGNGSGKTTFAKLLTGLYKPDSGSIKIDGNVVNSTKLGEYYSTVFDDFFLFKKLYNIHLEGKRDIVDDYLQTLRLTAKVNIANQHFTTLDLSRGQRKRLALLKCYLEDKPIYLFDEWAADQDPQFRKFFYRDLLMKMKQDGKIVIAITHDDQYFDVADKILKLNMGKLEEVPIANLAGVE